MKDDPMDEVEVEVDMEEVPPVAVLEAAGPALKADDYIFRAGPRDPLFASLEEALRMVGDPCCVAMPNHRAKLTWILELARASLR